MNQHVFKTGVLLLRHKFACFNSSRETDVISYSVFVPFLLANQIVIRTLKIFFEHVHLVSIVDCCRLAHFPILSHITINKKEMLQNMYTSIEWSI
jgi:hypothetical protein